MEKKREVREMIEILQDIESLGALELGTSERWEKGIVKVSTARTMEECQAAVLELVALAKWPLLKTIAKLES